MRFYRIAFVVALSVAALCADAGGFDSRARGDSPGRAIG